MQSLPYNVYRDHLTSLYHGHAIWGPDPGNEYDQVRVGDVGYVTEGNFHRMFNVLLEWNHPSNHIFCRPGPFPRLDPGPFVNIRRSAFPKGEYYSRYVVSTPEWVNPGTTTPDDIPGTTYRCRNKQGALLVVPHDGLREDVIRREVFEDYIRDHVGSWFSLATAHRLGIQRMEDLILVTGCTLVTSWGVAAFVDKTLTPEITLRIDTPNNRGANFDWRMIRPGVESHNSPAYSPRQNQCVFIRGLRAKRTFFRIRLRAEAEPLPDDPDNSPRDRTGVKTKRATDVTTCRDPVIGVLDYIAERCPNNTMAIAHDDDLRIMKDVGTFNAETVEGFLRQNQTGVFVKNGAATLHETELKVPDETKAIFYAEAVVAGESILFILHPVLSKYLLKLDIANQPPDYDYHLPNEDLTSPATSPAVPVLRLESRQGYPQHIIVFSSSGSPGVEVTVQDVLRTIHEDIKRPSHRQDWAGLNAKEQAEVDATYRERCRKGQAPDLTQTLIPWQEASLKFGPGGSTIKNLR